MILFHTVSDKNEPEWRKREAGDHPDNKEYYMIELSHMFFNVTAMLYVCRSAILLTTVSTPLQNQHRNDTCGQGVL
jgi:hypothetical protein